MVVSGPVLIVVRHSFDNLYRHRRSVNIGVTSSIEKAWKLIERDFRLIPEKEKMIGRFTDTSPWGGVFDGVEFKSDDIYPKLRYHIEVHPIDLFDD